MFHRFTGLPTAVTRYHQSVGVALNLYLDAFVDKFYMGFFDMGNVGSLPCTLSCTGTNVWLSAGLLSGSRFHTTPAECWWLSTRTKRAKSPPSRHFRWEWPTPWCIRLALHPVCFSTICNTRVSSCEQHTLEAEGRCLARQYESPLSLKYSIHIHSWSTVLHTIVYQLSI